MIDIDPKVQVFFGEIQSTEDLSDVLEDILRGDDIGLGETGILLPYAMQEAYGNQHKGMVEFHSPMGEFRMDYELFSHTFEREIKNSKFFSEKMNVKLDLAMKAISNW